MSAPRFTFNQRATSAQRLGRAVAAPLFDGSA